MSTRRKKATSGATTDTSPNGTVNTSRTMPSTQQRAQTILSRSPFLPTPHEAALLLAYPATLLLGSLYSILSPQARAAPYDVDAQAHPPDFAPSYFAHKRNAFNVYFVKRGWGWTSVALLLFALTHPSLGASVTLTPRRLRALARWAAATAWWVAVTQWFFGPAIIERTFGLTGGKCEEVLRRGDEKASDPLTRAACRAAGGAWRGGHDISGHVFLLILGSGALLLEVLPVLLARGRSAAGGGFGADRVVVGSPGKRVGRVDEVELTRTEGPGASAGDDVGSAGGIDGGSGVGVKFALAVAGLSWWMLFMTAAYFHTWFEKATGLLVALAALWTIYLLPRGVPAIRAVLGMPGV